MTANIYFTAPRSREDCQFDSITETSESYPLIIRRKPHGFNLFIENWIVAFIAPSAIILEWLSFSFKLQNKMKLKTELHGFFYRGILSEFLTQKEVEKIFFHTVPPQNLVWIKMSSRSDTIQLCFQKKNWTPEKETTSRISRWKM